MSRGRPYLGLRDPSQPASGKLGAVQWLQSRPALTLLSLGEHLSHGGKGEAKVLRDLPW